MLFLALIAVLEVRDCQPLMMRTADMLSSGLLIHLRKEERRQAPLAMVASVGVSQQAACILSVQWSESAQRSFGRPHEGEHFTCQALAQGTLIVCQGEIVDLAAGQLPRVRLRMQDHCVALKLRHHQRYFAQGSGTLRALSDEKSCTVKVPRPLDISEGGFGLDVADADWEAGEQLAFELEVFVEQAGQPRRDLPSLGLSGTACVCAAQRQQATGVQHLGCRFVELAAESRAALDFWLAIHACLLRQD